MIVCFSVKLIFIQINADNYAHNFRFIEGQKMEKNYDIKLKSINY